MPVQPMPDRPPAADAPRGRLERVTASVEATEALGASLGGAVRAAWPAAGPVILLAGPLGAGKTAFVRGLARGLGLAAGTRSPTFAIHLIYEGAPGLHHLDLYRLRGGVDLDEIGLPDLMAGPGPVALEWPDRLGPLEGLAAALGPRLIQITLQPGEGDERHVTIEAAERWRRILAEPMEEADARPGH